MSDQHDEGMSRRDREEIAKLAMRQIMGDKQEIMIEGQGITVPEFLTTSWDEDGEPKTGRRIDKCTAEDIETYISHLQGQVEELLDVIRNLTKLYVAEPGSIKIVDNTGDDTP